MYILNKNKYKTTIVQKKNKKLVVIIVPSTPHNDVNRFIQIIKSVIGFINLQPDEIKWEICVLSKESDNRSPSENFSIIYRANIVIAECTEKKPNVFYMIGLAHAFGRPVCSCYKVNNGQNADIPFNVHGRQSLTYSLSTIGYQREFKNNLIDWIEKYE